MTQLCLSTHPSQVLTHKTGMTQFLGSNEASVRKESVYGQATQLFHGDRKWRMND